MTVWRLAPDFDSRYLFSTLGAWGASLQLHIDYALSCKVVRAIGDLTPDFPFVIQHIDAIELYAARIRVL